MENSRLYPWIQEQWQHIVQRYQAGQLPHALMLSGPVGLGKFQLARQLAEALLCDENKQATSGEAVTEPCGHCNGCHLMAAGTHPDFKLLAPEGDSKQIPIDAVRETSRFLTLKSQFAPIQVVIVAPAEAMNKYAANSLLKTLEEPTPNSLILLVASQPSRLLPTIRSRCQSIEFTLPDKVQALSWMQAQESMSGLQSHAEQLLALAGGAPLLALDYAQQGTLDSYQQLLSSLEKIAKKQADPVTEAKRWETVGLAQSVKWLYFWVASLIHLKSGAGQVDNNAVWREPTLDFLLQRLNLQQLYRYLDQVNESSRMINTSANVQLALEELLISWYRLDSDMV